MSFGHLTPILRYRLPHQKVPPLDKEKDLNILKLESKFIEFKCDSEELKCMYVCMSSGIKDE